MKQINNYLKKQVLQKMITGIECELRFIQMEQIKVILNADRDEQIQDVLQKLYDREIFIRALLNKAKNVLPLAIDDSEIPFFGEPVSPSTAYHEWEQYGLSRMEV